MPETKELKANPNRYLFRIMDADLAFDLLSDAFQKLISGGMKKIILTVSPVPLQTTLSGMDCVIANSYSKSVMRVCAERLRQNFEGFLDYFPSYEMILSGGEAVFAEDLVHPSDAAVDMVTQYMVTNYVSSTEMI